MAEAQRMMLAVPTVGVSFADLKKRLEEKYFIFTYHQRKYTAHVYYCPPQLRANHPIRITANEWVRAEFPTDMYSDLAALLGSDFPYPYYYNGPMRVDPRSLDPDYKLYFREDGTEFWLNTFFPTNPFDDGIPDVDNPFGYLRDHGIYIENKHQIYICALKTHWDTAAMMHYLLVPTRKVKRTESGVDWTPRIKYALDQGIILDADEKIVEYYIGPPPSVREAYLHQYPDERKRVADYLLQQSGVLMDMTNDLMVPWKEMLFFHGSPNRFIQHGMPKDGDIVGVGTRNRSHTYQGYMPDFDLYQVEDNHTKTVSVNIALNQLFPSTHPEAIPDRTCKLRAPAFTTPYLAKAYNYSISKLPVRYGWIYTYRLLVEPSQLRMLDLRTDYHPSSLGTQNDPFHIVSELTGISHALKYRTRIRTNVVMAIQEFFKDAIDNDQLDGIVLNNDCEWVWFKAAKTLEWVNNTLLSLSLLPPQSHEDDFTLTIQRYTAKLKTETLLSLLATKSRVTKSLSQLRFYRWVIDPDAQVHGARKQTRHTYANQYLATSKRSRATGLWTAPIRIPTAVVLSDENSPLAANLYEIGFEELMKAVAPDLMGLYLAGASTEGDYAHVNPYFYLLDVLSKMPGTRLLVKMPNGRTQLVPPMSEELWTLYKDHQVKVAAEAEDPYGEPSSGEDEEMKEESDDEDRPIVAKEEEKDADDQERLQKRSKQTRALFHRLHLSK